MRGLILAGVAACVGLWALGQAADLCAQAIPPGTGTDADIAWQARYDGGHVDTLRGIAPDKQGNVYVTGYSFTGANFDCVTVAFDKDGKKIWEKRQDGGGNDAGHAIAADAQGSVYVAGFTSNGANDDFLLVKYDPAGNVLWQKKYDSGNEDWAHGVGIDSELNVYLTGSSWSDAGNWVPVTIQYDSAGKEQWQKSEGKEFAPGMAVGGQDHIYVAGETGAKAKAYDSTGKLLWQQEDQFPPPTWTGWSLNRGIAVDAHENVYVTGGMQSKTTDDMNIILVKYRQNGDVAWKNDYNDYGNDQGNAVAVDGEGSAYIAFDDSLMKCSPNGERLWSKRLPEVKHSGAVACDPEGNVYVGATSDHEDYVIMKLRKR